MVLLIDYLTSLRWIAPIKQRRSMRPTTSCQNEATPQKKLPEAHM